MDDPEGYPVSDILQASATVAGLAIALATFTQTWWLALLFALGGLASLAGTGYALSVLWRRRGLDWPDLIPGRRRQHRNSASEALVWFAWGAILLMVAYIAMMINRLPE